MLSFKNFLNEEYEFSSTQLNFTGKVASMITDFANSIPDDDLAEDGRETTPHITIKYGIHAKCCKEIEALELPESITVILGKTSLFENDSGDVLKIDVESSGLVDLNKLIANSVKVTDTFPDYHPHATIAYLKPGMGKKYEGDDTFNGITATFKCIYFSSSDDKITKIDLGR